MQKMIALRRHAYGVGNKEKGERYEATAHEARTLVALGWSKYDDGEEAPAGPAVPPDPKPAASADGDDSPAKDASPPKPAKDAKPPKPEKRKYERRDMRARD